MTTANLQTRLLFDGGWATDFGPSAPVSVGQDGVIRVPYLVDAENAVFDLDGGPRKIGGTERVYSTALNSGATVRGLVDFWRLGTSGSASQHRVVHVGDELMKDDGDGSFTTILGALGARSTTSIPSYAIHEDELIIFSNASSEPPLRWNGEDVSASLLGTPSGNTPNCAFGIYHKNRLFMAGDITKPSRVYYSEPLPNGGHGDWDAVEAGFFDVDPDDNDEVRGFASHKRILWIFKGPNDGSIHTLRGDTPLGGVTAFASATQPRPYELDIFIRGVGAVGHNSIFRFRDDVGFIDGKTGSVRSSNATEKFGDMREASLSFPINDYLLERVNRNVLQAAWAINDVAHGRSLITLPVDASTTNNLVLSMDYRFDPPRWSPWPVVEAQCLASVIDTTRTNRQAPYIGDTSGYVRRTDTANRSIDETTAIGYKVTLPYLDFGNPVKKKTYARGAVGIEPKGAYNGTFLWSRDDNAQQSTTFSQGGGDVLAGSTGIWGVSSIVENGDDVTITTTGGGGGGATHGRSEGDIIALINMNPSSYNGVYTINFVGSTTTFDITDPNTTFQAFTSGSMQYTSTSNFFALGTSTLGGARFVDRFFSLEEGGEFRSIQYQILQSGLNEDIAIHSLFAEIELGADSTEND